MKNTLIRLWKAAAVFTPIAGATYAYMNADPEDFLPRAPTSSAIEEALQIALSEPFQISVSPTEAPTPPPVEATEASILSVGNYDLRFEEPAQLETMLSADKMDSFLGAPISDELNDVFLTAGMLTPYPYEYWVRAAYAESTFNPEAINEATDARGLFQVVPSTALEILYDMQRSGNYDFIPEANLVRRSFVNGVAEYSVLMAYDQRAVLESVLFDPMKSIFVAAEFNSKYLPRLQREFPDRPTNSLDSYLVHWQGGGGAVRLVGAHVEDPTSPAFAVYGASSAIVLNHKSIFYNSDESARTLDEMFSHIRETRGLGNIEFPDVTQWQMPETMAIINNQDSGALMQTLANHTYDGPRPFPRRETLRVSSLDP